MLNKRFVLLCQHFYPEMISTGMHMTELASRLTELGWQVTVYCAQPSWGIDSAKAEPVPAEINYQGICIRRVRTVGRQQGSLLARLLFAVSFLVATGWALWQTRADYPGLVVTTNPPFLGLVGWLYARLLKRPYLLIVYDIYPEIAVQLGALGAHSWLTKLWQRVTELILRTATVVVVIGRDMAAVVKAKVPQGQHGRIVLIPNWSDERQLTPVPKATNPFRQEHGLAGAFVVQYAGRMGRTHNLEPLIEAAQLLRSQNILFQLIGEGAKKAKLEQLVAEYGLINVQFLPYQPLETLSAMLSAADVAVVCLESFYTGLSVPSKAYGVMASATPILGLLDPASEIGQMISETGCRLILCDPTAQQVATVLSELRADPGRRQAMGAAGRQAFLAKYSLTRAALAYDAALTAMLGDSERHAQLLQTAENIVVPVGQGVAGER